MNESLRKAYLDAMGIHVFVSKTSEPIEEEQDLSVQDVVQTESVDSRLPAASQGVQPGASPEAESLGRLLGSASPDHALQSEQQVTNTSSESGLKHDAPHQNEQEQPVRFVVQLWHLPGNLVVLDAREAQEVLPTQALLLNVLAHFGWQRSDLPKPERLVWPPAGLSQGVGWQEAAEMMQAFLEARLEQRPVQALLLFGEAARRCVLSKPSDDCAYYKTAVYNNDEKNIPVASLPSLKQFLHEPLQKRSLWLFLSAFIEQHAR